MSICIYQVVGDGPIDLVWIHDWISNLELQWEEPLQARFLQQLASFSRLLLFDKRGSGLSDRTVGLDLFTFDVRIDDVRSVMERLHPLQLGRIGDPSTGQRSWACRAMVRRPRRPATLRTAALRRPPRPSRDCRPDRRSSRSIHPTVPSAPAWRSCRRRALPRPTLHRRAPPRGRCRRT